jgi:hypothetical protein
MIPEEARPGGVVMWFHVVALTERLHQQRLSQQPMEDF